MMTKFVFRWTIPLSPGKRVCNIIFAIPSPDTDGAEMTLISSSFVISQACVFL